MLHELKYVSLGLTTLWSELKPWSQLQKLGEEISKGLLRDFEIPYILYKKGCKSESQFHILMDS